MNDVGSLGCQQHVFVGVRRVTFCCADKSRTEVGQIRTEQLRGENLMAVVQTSCKQECLVEELTDLGNQRKRAPGAGMPASTGRNGNEPVDTGFSGFLGMASRGHVVKHQTAIAVHRVDQFLHRAEAGDNDRHLMLHADVQIRLKARVAVVNNQVHRIRGRIIQRRQARFDLFQPGLEPTAFALVKSRKAADHAVAAAGEHQFRIGDQKHRRRNHGQTQTLFEHSGQRHREPPKIFID